VQYLSYIPTERKTTSFLEDLGVGARVLIDQSLKKKSLSNAVNTVLAEKLLKTNGWECNCCNCFKFVMMSKIVDSMMCLLETLVMLVFYNYVL
jgi:hypothetical protein